VSIYGFYRIVKFTQQGQIHISGILRRENPFVFCIRFRVDISERNTNGCCGGHAASPASAKQDRKTAVS
jgi:hypothetical protein